MSENQTEKAVASQPLTTSGMYDPEHDQLLSIDRNARAYGWEIGHHGLDPLPEVLTTSPDNPFLDPNWRAKVEQ